MSFLRGGTMRGIALVINAVNIILRHLAEEPDCTAVRELRQTALGYINEVVMWRSTLPPVEEREALMTRVLALHVAVSKLGVARRVQPYAVPSATLA
jgi:hypothetical protein